jgi:hypothetical protein
LEAGESELCGCPNKLQIQMVASPRKSNLSKKPASKIRGFFAVRRLISEGPATICICIDSWRYGRLRPEAIQAAIIVHSL